MKKNKITPTAKLIERTARASIIDELQTQTYLDNPHGKRSLRTATIRAAAIQTLAATPGGIPNSIANTSELQRE
ncbi:hypothetical protein [Bacteroides sp.]|uniref:hypothetical protein n=1 Tax=Bacteroides sp. TaxID=29523 RepID=UPI00263186F6|nr:hypothetical protein [Bacteroides sp.]MDD3038679.1 hypothetical protein [Bacteroides sp.]